ncbi:MAG: type II secretion system F family protein [Nitriliruptor sp.]|uniref:type II secretion system F family protein n=1 Tax=Nitriliruptor sp. TaxID=2448056 RepID=UPI0034A08984
MNPLVALSGLLLWAGLTLLLSELRWFSRRSIVARLGPYVPGGMGVRSRAGVLSVESFREAVGPLARLLGSQFSRLFGVTEDLDRRLTRIHSRLDVTEFRVRQIGWAIAGFGIGLLATIAFRPPAVVGPLLMLGGMLLAFLLLEQQVSGASDRWKRSVYLELPVVAEQVGMLLGSGFSLSAALDRVAGRGSGSAALDIRRVLSRVRQGVSEEVALREWADLVEVDALDRLVSVLALNREATDLGRLIAEEARAIRLDVQRELVERMEARGQQVWIPVTVATLVPGVIFIAVPFTRALGGFLTG